MKHWGIVVLAVVVVLGACGGDGDAPAATASPFSREASPSLSEASPASSPGVPTPDARGKISGLTLDQAAQVAPFELVVPNSIPDEFVFDGADASPLPATAGVSEITLYFRWSDNTLGRISVKEALGGGLQTNPATTTETTETIAGTEVKKVLSIRSDNTRAVLYGWNLDDTLILVSGVSPNPETDAAIERLVAAMMH